MSLGCSARPAPICAASWPSSGTQMPSWPWRCSALRLPVERGGPAPCRGRAPAARRRRRPRRSASKRSGRPPARPRGSAAGRGPAALVGAAEPGDDVLAGWSEWGADGDSWRVAGIQSWGTDTGASSDSRARPGSWPTRARTDPARDHPGRGWPRAGWSRHRGTTAVRAGGGGAAVGGCVDQRSLLPGKGRSPVRSGSTVDRVGRGAQTGGGVVDGAVVVSGSGVAGDAP